MTHRYTVNFFGEGGTMTISQRLASGLALAALFTVPAAAQDAHNLIFMARGGGFTALEDFSSSLDTKTGYTVGGSVGVQLSKYLVIRGDFDYARDELQVNDVDTDRKMNRYFYGATLQLQYPTSTGFTPYLLAGGGGVTLDQPNGESKTRGQGTFGLGLAYDFPNSPFGLFVEGRTYIYKASGINDGFLTNVDKTQYDLAWTGGLSWTLPF